MCNVYNVFILFCMCVRMCMCECPCTRGYLQYMHWYVCNLPGVDRFIGPCVDQQTSMDTLQQVTAGIISLRSIVKVSGFHFHTKSNQTWSNARWTRPHFVTADAEMERNPSRCPTSCTNPSSGKSQDQLGKLIVPKFESAKKMSVSVMETINSHVVSLPTIEWDECHVLCRSWPGVTCGVLSPQSKQTSECRTPDQLFGPIVSRGDAVHEKVHSELSAATCVNHFLESLRDVLLYCFMVSSCCPDVNLHTHVWGLRYAPHTHMVN